LVGSSTLPRPTTREGAMLKITNLVKTANTDPQEFTLVLNDLEKTTKGYVFTTKSGTESEIRGLLKSAGLSDAEIDTAISIAPVG
jgi:hypothetical protein